MCCFARGQTVNGVMQYVMDDLMMSLREAERRSSLQLETASGVICGLSLPHKGNLIPLNDRVSQFAGKFEIVCVHKPHCNRSQLKKVTVTCFAKVTVTLDI